MAQVTELVTAFTFRGSEAPLTKYNAALGRGIGLLAGMTAALAASGAAVARWASGVLGAEQSLINLSAETGVAVDKLQELRYIASVSNSDVGALDSSITGLAAKIGEAAQQGSEDFARLGISVRTMSGQVKSADQVLAEVGARFRQMNLSLNEQRSFAEALGIDPSLVTMLNRTSGEMAELAQRARELGTLTEEQTNLAMEYNDSMTTLRFAMDGVRRLVAVGLAPELKSLVTRFTDLLTENRDWIINGVRFGLGVLNDFLDFLGRMWPVLAAGAGLFVALKVATLGWAGALGILLSPALLIAAGIAALLLIIDDLIVAFQGGESVIRNFFLAFFDYDITPALQAIVQGFREAFDVVRGLAEGFIVAVGGILSGIGNILTGNFSEGLEDLRNAFTIWIDTLAEAFKSVFSGVFDWAKEAVAGLMPDWIRDLVSGDDDSTETVSPNRGMDQSFRPGGSRSEAAAQYRAYNQDVEINIRTSDPERAGRAAADGLQRQMEDAQVQSNRGGM